MAKELTIETGYDGSLTAVFSYRGKTPCMGRAGTVKRSIGAADIDFALARKRGEPVTVEPSANFNHLANVEAEISVLTVAELELAQQRISGKGQTHSPSTPSA